MKIQDVKHAQSEIQQAASSLIEAGNRIDDAYEILNRYCSPRGQNNWDQRLPWKIAELKRMKADCREMAMDLRNAADGLKELVLKK